MVSSPPFDTGPVNIPLNPVGTINCPVKTCGVNKICVDIVCVTDTEPVISAEPVISNEPVISAEPENGNPTPPKDDVGIAWVIPKELPTKIYPSCKEEVIEPVIT